MPILIKEDRSIVVTVRSRSADVDPQVVLTAAERAQLLAIATKLQAAGRAAVLAQLDAERAEVDSGA
jgi:phage replication-related protein YjqB (UPF0714/DUF867 family)